MRGKRKGEEEGGRGGEKGKEADKMWEGIIREKA